MNILRLSLFATIVLLSFAWTTPQLQDECHNVTHWARSRQKRFLLFSNLGVHKYIVSIALPVAMNDKRAWRSLFGAWNFQWQHLLPTTIQHWWNSTYFPASNRRSFGEAVLPIETKDQPTDLTGMFLYALFESYMDNRSINGRECLLRAICENAQVDLIGGVFDRVYKRLLTPERAMDQYYHDAYAVGAKGADCYKTYFACPKGDSLFDKFVLVEDI